MVLVLVLLPSLLLAKYSHENPNPFYDALWGQQRAMFSEADFNWDARTYHEYIDKVTSRGINPPLGEKRQRAFQFFQRMNDPLVPDKKSSMLGTEVAHDLNLYCGGKDKHTFLASRIDTHIATEIGRITCYTHLANPHRGMEGIPALETKQQIIQAIAHDTKLCTQLSTILTSMASAEPALLWLLTDYSFENNVKKDCLFDFYKMDWLNDSEQSLLMRNTFVHAEAALTLVLGAFGAVALPLFAFNIFDKIGAHAVSDAARTHRGNGGPLFQSLLWWLGDQGNQQLLTSGIICASGVACALRMPRLVTEERDSYFFDHRLQAVEIVVARYLNGLRQLHAALAPYPHITQRLQCFDRLENFVVRLPKKLWKLKKLLAVLKTDTFKGKPSHIAHRGRVLLVFKFLMEFKAELQKVLLAAGEIDLYQGLAQLCTHEQYCFAEYLQADVPSIELENFWNPFVQKPILNSISLGGTERRNAVITGPNEGGKSTALKAIPICLLMAQTFGIAPATRCAITPFAAIATHLNVTDDIGQGNSLFKAELLRAQELLKTIASLGPQEFSFVAFDEMFNSTTPIEGGAAAFSVAKHIGQSSQSVCVVATHFAILTKLELETDSFANYKVSVIINPDGSITRQFKLEKGISDQHVAILALGNQGMASDILATAQNLVNQQT